MGKISLIIDDNSVISFRINETLSIGRDPENDFQVFDPRVSRFHCLIEREGRHFVIRDRGSSNGTYINGALVSKKLLSDGDQIRIGSTSLLYEQGKEAETEKDRVETGSSQSGGMTIIDSSFKMKDLTDFYRTDVNPKNFRKILEKLSTLFEIGNIINVHRDSVSLLNAILEQIVHVVRADRYYLLLFDEKKGRLTHAATYPLSGREDSPPKISKTILDTVFREGKSVLSTDAFHDERFQHAGSILMYEIQTVMCVPLRSHEKILGVIHVDSRDPENIFTKDDLKLLTAIGINSGVAIENLNLYEDLKRLFRSTVKSLVAALEANDPYTGGHSVRVADYSKQLAECLKLSNQDIEEIELAAFLHDIGKIGIPNDVLNKVDSFDASEYAFMKRHPVIGCDILSEIEGMEEIARMVRHHHERFDGKGYPDGLAGKDIPLGSRILCITDAIDAMATDRPYRKRRNFEDIIKEISRLSGTQFDPEIVDALRRCVSEKSIRMGCR